MIETARLLIRPYEIQDIECFYSELQKNKDHLDDYFSNMLKIKDDINKVKIYFNQKTADWEARKGYACGIFIKDTEQIIGHISIRDIDWRVPKGELAYFLFKTYTGQKFAVEALFGFRDWCIYEQGLNRLYMKIATDNYPSICTAERCQFEFEGLLKKDYNKKEKTLIDMNIYGFINPTIAEGR